MSAKKQSGSGTAVSAIYRIYNVIVDSTGHAWNADSAPDGIVRNYDIIKTNLSPSDINRRDKEDGPVIFKNNTHAYQWSRRVLGLQHRKANG